MNNAVVKITESGVSRRGVAAGHLGVPNLQASADLGLALTMDVELILPIVRAPRRVRSGGNGRGLGPSEQGHIAAAKSPITESSNTHP